MDPMELNSLKDRLLKKRQQTKEEVTGESEHKSAKNQFVTYVTTAMKITLPKSSKGLEPEDNGNLLLNNLKIQNPLLALVEQSVLNIDTLTCRSVKHGGLEILDVTRTKTDFTDDNGIPLTAARLLFTSDGLARFSLITGKLEEKKLNVSDADALNSDIEMLLRKLSDTHVFCLGLPQTLPEIRCYPHTFQFFKDSPYKHARSKNCLMWYEPSNQTSVRERMGVIQARCPPCKIYFCKIAKWCRDNTTNKQKKYEKSQKRKIENLSTTVSKIGTHLKTIQKETAEAESSELIKPRKRGRPPKINSKHSKEINCKIEAGSLQSKKKFVDQNVQTEPQKANDFKDIQISEINNVLDFTPVEMKAALLATVCSTHALYDASDDVVELTAGNFNGKVINGDEVWLVEFYAPWCGHCRNLAPDWKKAATALKGIVKVGAVDMDVHGSVGGPYNVRGFPTIKIFGANKNSPQDYNGARSAQAIVDEALRAAQRVAKDRLSRGGSSRGSGSGGSGGGSGGSDEVVELTDANFEKEVFGTKDPVLVEFFAPWCGHCQRLAPEWKKAASELKGKVKVAALDATVHTVMAGRFQVQGYPTIKVFRAGVKDFNSAEDYQGGRTASDIIAYALELHAAAVDPPEIMELVSNSVLTSNCNEKPLCVVSFLPDILDTQAEGRNKYLNILKELGEKYKAKLWGWVWTSAAVHGKLEQALGVGGFGYPAMAVVNIRKKVYVGLRGSFSYEGIDEMLKSIAVGRGRTEKLPNELPTISDVPAWDGLDGKLPEEEDIDLSDIDLDEPEDKKDEL